MHKNHTFIVRHVQIEYFVWTLLTFNTDNLHTIINGQFTGHESASQMCKIFHVSLKNETKVVTCPPHPKHTELLQL